MTADIGDRYEVGPFSNRWAVYDRADGSRHSTHPDEFEAIIAAAKANANVRAKRARAS